MISLAPLNSPERLSSIGRLFLTIAILTGFSFDRDFDAAPARDVVQVILQVYLVYAIVALVLASMRPLTSGYAKIASHALDLCIAALLSALVEGASSPFFALFIFALFSASLRFGSGGVMITGGLVLAFYVSFAVVAWSVPEIDLTRFAARSSHLVVVVVLLTYLTTYLQSLREQMAKLALWPREWKPDLSAFAEELLRRAASLLRVPTVVVVWEDAEEPWMYVARLRNEEFSISTVPPDRFLPIVRRPLEDLSFLAERVGPHFVVRNKSGTPAAYDYSPVNPALADEYGLMTSVSAAFSGENLSGRTFFSGRAGLAFEDIVLGEIVTGLIGLSLQQYLIIEQLKRSAVTDERVRMARDLHDGIVQSLAGVNLHLHVLDRLIEDDPDQARRTLHEISDALLADQRELRSYIAQLRPMSGSDDATSLAGVIEVLASRIEREWGVKVSATVEAPADLISPGMRDEVFRIMREAITNAAKHARATLIVASLRLRGNRLAITVEDNGRGLPFTGRHTLAELQTAHRGPITLKERVSSVGGDLVLESSPSGTRIEIVVPLSLFEVHSDYTSVAG